MPKKSPKRKYSKSAQKDVENEMRRYKRGKAHSGRGEAPVKSRKQAIAIGLSKARAKGKKVPKPSTKKSKKRGKKSTRKKSSRSKSK